VCVCVRSPHFVGTVAPKCDTANRVNIVKGIREVKGQVIDATRYMD